MIKRTFKIFIILVSIVAILFCFACSAPSWKIAELGQKIADLEQGSPSPEIITEAETITALNQTYEGPALNITATDIRAIQSSYFDSGKIGIGVLFEVENVSNETNSFYSGNMTAYVDDIAVKQLAVDSVVFGEEYLSGGDVAPGKRLVGYYCVEVPKDVKKIELYVKDFLTRDTQVIFTFDVPPIEEIDS